MKLACCWTTWAQRLLSEVYYCCMSRCINNDTLSSRLFFEHVARQPTSRQTWSLTTPPQDSSLWSAAISLSRADELSVHITRRQRPVVLAPRSDLCWQRDHSAWSWSETSEEADKIMTEGTCWSQRCEHSFSWYTRRLPIYITSILIKHESCVLDRSLMIG